MFSFFFFWQEVLANPDITLDHRFILSLVYDIAKVYYTSYTQSSYKTCHVLNVLLNLGTKIQGLESR